MQQRSAKASCLRASGLATTLCIAATTVGAEEPEGLFDLMPYDSLELLEEQDEHPPDALLDKAGDRSLSPAESPFTFVFAYTSLFQWADKAQQQREGSGGDVDLLASYNLATGANGGQRKLVFHLEQRHKYGTYPPANLSDSIGNHLATTTYFFNEQDLALVELYYDVENEAAGYAFRIGKQDPGANFNAFTWGDPETGFMGGGVVDSATPFPDLGWGAAAQFRLTPETYLKLGIQDANADATKIGFETLKEGQFIVAAEIGYVPQTGLLAQAPSKYSMLMWHRDRTQDPASTSGYGLAFTGEQALPSNPNIVPFLRYSWADGAAAAKQHFSAGLVFQNVFGQSDDVIGLAGSWVELADPTLRNESSFEAFYRFHITPNFSITPDVQVIWNPAMTMAYDKVVVLSLRARLVF